MKHCSVPFLTKWCIKLHLEGRGRWEGGGGGVGQQSYRVALLRLGGAIYSDTIGWWCQLWHVCLDEAASVDETNGRKAENIVTVSKHYTAKVTQQHNNNTQLRQARPALTRKEKVELISLWVSRRPKKETEWNKWTKELCRSNRETFIKLWPCGFTVDNKSKDNYCVRCELFSDTTAAGQEIPASKMI